MGAADLVLAAAAAAAAAVAARAWQSPDEAPLPWQAGAAAVVVALALAVQRLRRGALAASNSGYPPPGAPLTTELPLLGHALAYKRDPPGFLLRNAAASRGVFTLNLAGFRTTILTDPAAMRAAAAAPPSVLSLRHAVGDFGFVEALGALNVFVGGGVHRLTLKNRLYPRLDADAAPLLEATRAAVAAHVPPGRETTVDLLPTMRRVLLHASVAMFIGPSLLSTAPDFIDEYIRFQDELEEAIAKAVVLPKWLARPLHLAPVARMRARLVAALTEAIERMWAGGAPGGPGTWTAAIRTMDPASVPGYSDLVGAVGDGNAPSGAFSAEDAAELEIGLLFAAHKNPGIGAGQALLYLLEPGNAAVAREVEAELLGDAAARVHGGAPARAVPDADALAATPKLNACVLEALRLCSHSIGAVRKVVDAGGFRVPTTRGEEYTLPQGAFIGISHIVPHLDPGSAVWGPEPGAFRPFEHFLGRSDGDAGDYDMTAFSHGLHKCPGRRLATLQMSAAVAALLTDFEATPENGAVPPLCFKRATLAQRTGPCMVRFSPRGAPKAGAE